MSGELPTREELRRGQTVRIVQDQENNPGEPLLGEVLKIVDEEDNPPGGVKVKLKSGVVGRVKEIHPDES